MGSGNLSVERMMDFSIALGLASSIREDCKDCDSAEKPYECFDGLSMNGKSPTISEAPPFVLRFSKDERRVFQQNHNLINLW